MAMSKRPQIFDAPPAALRYMAQALRPSRGWRQSAPLPDISLVWKNFCIAAQAADRLRELMGGAAAQWQDSIALLAPGVLGFRLLMVMLTHPAWPLPIWRALQVRNRLQLHRPLRIDEKFDLSAQPSGWRVLEKGLEIDLHSRLLQADQCVWESVVTFYYRGRFGSQASGGFALGAAPEAPVIKATGTDAAQWRTEHGGRWQFGALTGDYNGLHQWSWYARRLGFAAAFAHPQRLAAQCLGRLASPMSGAMQLDLWLKGPVFYGRDVALGQLAHPGGHDFSLTMVGEDRPALVGSLRRQSGVQ